MSETYLIRREAAKHVKERGLPCTANTLQKLATVGGGPEYQIFGNKAVYTEPNLDRWIDEKLSPLREPTSVLAEVDAAEAEDEEAAAAEAERHSEGEEEDDSEEETEALKRAATQGPPRTHLKNFRPP